jgi:selenocysteine lyase/cysteine desulfurase
MDRRSFLTRVAVPGLVAGLTARVDASSTGLLARGSVNEGGPFAPAQDAADSAVFAEARRQFLIPDGVAYCNTGTLGASPREVMDVLTSGLMKLERDLAAWPYERPEGEPLTGYQPLVEARAAVGKFVGVGADEIALTQNATMGMNFLGQGLDLASGDEVLSTDQEHGGGISVWRLRAKRHGIVLKELPLTPALAGGPEAILKLFADAFTARTRVLMVSHITSGLGIKLPIEELSALARERGALSLIDGAQAVGQIQVDVRELGCDGYVGSPHKWMLAPKGTGFLYIRKDVQDRFWTTLASQSWDDKSRGAFRLMQYGTGSVPVVDGLIASLGFFDRLGMARVERWDAMLTKRLRDGLAKIPKARLTSPADPRLTAAITTFRVDGVPAKALQDALWARKVRVRAQNDQRGVRLSAHLYNSPADIDTVLDVAGRLG